MSCSPSYLFKAAYTQTTILLNREKISDILVNSKYSPETQFKLEYVLKARKFALEIGLKVNDSYTTYSQFNNDVVSWVLTASKIDKIEPKIWWFPIAGSFPYKGFFNKKDAIKESSVLEKKGYESLIRGAEAYSTLGWFNDPVLTPMLEREPVDFTDTIIHESLHQTVWISDNINFNESLANFIGIKGTLNYFQKQFLDLCFSINPNDLTIINYEVSNKFLTNFHEFERSLSKAEEENNRSKIISLAVKSLGQELSILYHKDIPFLTKLEKKKDIFYNANELINKNIPNLNLLSESNNSVFIQLEIYFSNFELFNKILLKENNDIRLLIEKLKSFSSYYRIEEKSYKDKKNSPLDPFLAIDKFFS